jgi:signal transduction histidine kinase
MADGAGRAVPRTLIRASVVAMARSVALSVFVLAGAGLLFILAGSVALVVDAVRVSGHHGHLLRVVAVILAPVCWLLLALLVLIAIRPLANAVRRLSGSWCGVLFSNPYRPAPRDRHVRAQLRWLLTDPATWRDLLWAALNLAAGTFLLIVPAVVTGVGLIAFLGSRVTGAIPPPAYPGNSTASILVAGAALTAAGLAVTPTFLTGYGVFSGSLLNTPSSRELARRVQHLSRTRTETIDAGAAEVRRIERDLHDGAQARLVAMGMTLDAAGQLVHHNPQAAQALLEQARENSIQALKELRDLVRGIHPPVLADRGLADAVRALALDTPLSTHVVCDLAGRPPAPVESAAYFAVSELLANVAKHARASQVWIDLRHTEGTLRIGVTDDGRGGADPAGGTGLRGIERRIAAFDGVLAVSSPPGGPTAVTLELPCDLR